MTAHDNLSHIMLRGGTTRYADRTWNTFPAFLEYVAELFEGDRKRVMLADDDGCVWPVTVSVPGSSEDVEVDVTPAMVYAASKWRGALPFTAKYVEDVWRVARSVQAYLDETGIRIT